MIKPNVLALIRCLFNPTAWRLLPKLIRRRPQLQFLPLYLAQRREFIAKGGAIAQLHPILFDYVAQAGVASGDYFHQDLLVARLIHEANPERHVDIGSRIDGFVAHVASFRPIEIIDVRPLKEIGHKNIRFLQADLMMEGQGLDEIADSISCLNAIEHFGLGRYGDPITPDGHLRGFTNLVRMLKPGGKLYISFPIGPRTEVLFNAHRVFHPKDVLGWPTGGAPLELLRFDYVDKKGDLHLNASLGSFGNLSDYSCGIYVLRKPNA
jgi:SAM-dependent methyltransferase